MSEQDPSLTPKEYYLEARQVLAELAVANSGVPLPDADRVGLVDTVDRFLFIESVKGALVARSENSAAITGRLTELEQRLPPELARGTRLFQEMLPQIELGFGLDSADERPFEPLQCPEIAKLDDYVSAVRLATQALEKNIRGRFNSVEFVITPEMTNEEALRAWHEARAKMQGQA